MSSPEAGKDRRKKGLRSLRDAWDWKRHRPSDSGPAAASTPSQTQHIGGAASQDGASSQAASNPGQVALPIRQASNSTAHVGATPNVASARSAAKAQQSRPASLWDEAYQRLSASEDTRNALQKYEELVTREGLHGRSGQEVFPDLSTLSEAERERRLKAVLESRLEIAKREEMTIAIPLSQKQIRIKSSVRKVVNAVIWSQGFITDMVSVHPHAALAWAGVTCLLPFLTNPTTQDAAVLDALEYICPLLCRYQLMERDFFHSSSTITSSAVEEVKELNESLRDTIVELYCQVLRLQILAAVRLARHFVWTYFRDVANWDDWDDMMNSIKQTEAKGDKILASFSNHGIQALQYGMDQVHSDLQSIQAQRDEEMKKLDSMHDDIRAIKDVTVPDARLTPSKLFLVPRSVHSLFTGREEVLEKIYGLLDSSQSAAQTRQRRMIITGLGGQGKSEICLKVAEQMQNEFHHVLWVNVSNDASAKEAFINISRKLGKPAETLAEAVQTVAIQERSWLLVLDNADDPTCDYNKYLPPGVRGSVILTSRNPDLSAYAQPPDAHIPLAGLDDDLSVELLLKAAKANIQDEVTRGFAVSIVKLLGSHTLALIQAGSYIAEGLCNLADYPKVYDRKWRKVIDAVPSQERSEYGSVLATFEVSRAALASMDTQAAKDAIELSDCLSMMHHEAFPLSSFQATWEGTRKVITEASTLVHQQLERIDRLTVQHLEYLPRCCLAEFEEAWDSDCAIEACNLLKRMSLATMERTGVEAKLSLHPLVHDWTRRRQRESEVALRSWLAAGAMLAMIIYARNDWCQYVLRHHLKALSSAAPALLLPEEGWLQRTQVLFIVASGLARMVEVPAALKCLEQLRNLLNIDPHRPESSRFIEFYILWAHVQSYIDKEWESRMVMKEVVRIEGESPFAHWSSIEIRLDMCHALVSTGQTQGAINTLQALIAEGDGSTSHRDRLLAMILLAGIYVALHRFDDAIEMLDTALPVERSKLTPDDIHEIGMVLASAYLGKGLPMATIQILHDEVIPSMEAIYPADVFRLLDAKEVLARAYLDVGKHAEAIELLEKSSALYEECYATLHSREACSRDLTRAYLTVNRRVDAIAQIEKSIMLSDARCPVFRLEMTPGYYQCLTRGYPLSIHLETLRSSQAKSEAGDVREDNDRCAEIAAEYEVLMQYYHKGPPRHTHRLLHELVHAQNAILAPWDPARMMTVRLYAWLSLNSHWQQDGAKAALPILRRLVAYDHANVDPTDEGRRTDEINLAAALAFDKSTEGHLKEAIQLVREVMRIEQTLLAPEDPLQRTTEHFLALLYLWDPEKKYRSDVQDLLGRIIHSLPDAGAVRSTDRMSTSILADACFAANIQSASIPADACFAANMLEHTTSLYERMIEWTQNCQCDSETLSITKRLAQAYLASCRYDTAVAFLERALESRGPREAPPGIGYIVTEKVEKEWRSEMEMLLQYAKSKTSEVTSEGIDSHEGSEEAKNLEDGDVEGQSIALG